MATNPRKNWLRKKILRKILRKKLPKVLTPRITVKGLSLIFGVIISNKVKLGRWSDISEYRLPEENLYCSSFLGGLIKM